MLRFFLAILVLAWALPAVAGEGRVVQCGAPRESTLETDPGRDYCDIHGRRLAYKESRDAFREQVEERRRNFIKPGLEAKRAYQENLQVFYNE